MGPGRDHWWVWVACGVAWGLLCVGVRHIALSAGMEMQELVVRRHEVVTLVQALERDVAEAKRLDRIEALAAARGFKNPSAAQIVIASPVAEPGLMHRWFGGEAVASAATGGAPGDDGGLGIRPREEVVVTQRVIKKPAKSLKATPAPRKRGKRVPKGQG